MRNFLTNNINRILLFLIAVALICNVLIRIGLVNWDTDSCWECWRAYDVLDVTIWVLVTIWGTFHIRIKAELDLSLIVAFFPVIVSTLFAVMLSDSVALIVGGLFGTDNKMESIKILGLGIGIVPAIYGLVVLNKRAAAQVRANQLMEEGHAQERFKDAIEHLSDEKNKLIRFAALYELFFLVKGRDSYKQVVVEVLCRRLQAITDYNDDCEPENVLHANTTSEMRKHSQEVKDLVDLLFGTETIEVFSGFNFNLVGANLSGINFAGMYMSKGGVNFKSANLNGANLSYMDLQQAEFTSAFLCRAVLRRANMQSVVLQGANLQEADLRDANLQRADLQRAEMQNANLLFAKMQGINLYAAKLDDANLRDANLQGAELTSAKLKGADLSSAKLQKAVLYRADLRRSVESRTHLLGADLSEANLCYADLRGAMMKTVQNWHTASWRGAKYDDSTTLPDELQSNAENYGMVRCAESDDDA